LTSSPSTINLYFLFTPQKGVIQQIFNHKDGAMKKLFILVWQAWYEARLAYAKRYVSHRLGS